MNKAVRERLRRLKRFARLRARILRSIDIDPISQCWLWRGPKNKGHGIITVRVPGRRKPCKLYVHRVAWEAFHERKMPKGRVGAHSYKCVAAHCCNWEHIRATTQSANVRDQKRAKRWRERTLYQIFPPTHTITGA